MFRDCCLKLLNIELQQLDVEMRKARLGDVTLAFDPDLVSEQQIESLFNSLGF